VNTNPESVKVHIGAEENISSFVLGEISRRHMQQEEAIASLL
jgi:hypothetical protein